MRNMLFGALVLFACATAETVQADDAALGVVKKAVKAHGGETALKKYKAWTWKGQGQVNVMGMSIEYTGDWHVQSPDKFRVSIEATVMGQNITVTQVLNGKQAWTKIADTPTTEMTKLEQEIIRKQMAVEHLAALYPLLDTKKYTLSVVGDATVGKSKAVGINVSEKGGVDANLYFDKKSHMLVKQSYQTKDETGAEVSQEVFITNYKKVNGISFPAKMRVDRDGKTYVTSEMSDVKLKDKHDGSVFEKP